MTDPATQRTPSRLWLTLAIAWVVAATALFAVRGVYRGTGHGHDLKMIYAASRTWLHGHDAYNTEAMRQSLRTGGEAADPTLWSDYAVSLYPPGSYAVLSPLGALPWQGARLTWLAIGVIAWVLTIFGVLRLAGLCPRSPAGLAVAGLMLAWAPVHTCLATGQVSIVVAALIVWSSIAAGASRPMLAGAALGVAAAIKPQLAVLFVLFELLRGRWRVALPALGLVAIAQAVGAARLSLAGHDWWASLQANIANFESSLGAASIDSRAAGSLWFQMIDLRPLLHALGIASVDWAARLIVMALGFGALAVAWRRRTDWHDRAAIALAAVGTLFVTYHRAYDAVLLALVMAFAVSLFKARRRWQGGLLLAAGAVFISPGGALVLKALPNAGDQLLTTLIALHHNVALVVMAGLLVVVLGQRRPNASGAECAGGLIACGTRDP